MYDIGLNGDLTEIFLSNITLLCQIKSSIVIKCTSKVIYFFSSCMSCVFALRKAIDFISLSNIKIHETSDDTNLNAKSQSTSYTINSSAVKNALMPLMNYKIVKLTVKMADKSLNIKIDYDNDLSRIHAIPFEDNTQFSEKIDFLELFEENLKKLKLETANMFVLRIDQLIHLLSILQCNGNTKKNNLLKLTIGSETNDVKFCNVSSNSNVQTSLHLPENAFVFTEINKKNVSLILPYEELKLFLDYLKHSSQVFINIINYKAFILFVGSSLPNEIIFRTRGKKYSNFDFFFNNSDSATIFFFESNMISNPQNTNSYLNTNEKNFENKIKSLDYITDRQSENVIASNLNDFEILSELMLNSSLKTTGEYRKNLKRSKSSQPPSNLDNGMNDINEWASDVYELLDNEEKLNKKKRGFDSNDENIYITNEETQNHLNRDQIFRVNSEKSNSINVKTIKNYNYNADSEKDERKNIKECYFDDGVAVKSNLNKFDSNIEINKYDQKQARRSCTPQLAKLDFSQDETINDLLLEEYDFFLKMSNIMNEELYIPSD